MARLESVAVGGYFPTPDHLLPWMAARIDPAPARERHPGADSRRPPAYPTLALLDPCAGDGAALLACAQVLLGTPFPEWDKGPQVRFYAVELEAARAQALTVRLRAATPRYDQVAVLHSDSFTVTWTTGPGREGVQVLWLNPPYDTDPVHGRLEQAFLARWTPVLTPGSGILVFIVPGYALAASAATLAAEYDDLHCYRFPAADYAAFRQVVLLARRRAAPAWPGATARLVARLDAWAADPLALPVLPAPGSTPPDLALPPGVQGGLTTFQAHALELDRVRRYARPWTVGASDLTAPPADPPPTPAARRRGGSSLTPVPALGVHQPLSAFLCRQMPVAMPPKPAYLALLLASGQLNGRRVEPDDPAAGWPPILVKGRFKKDLVTVKETTDQQGRPTSQVLVQQPVLSVCILALTTPPRYVDLAPGTTPTGATTVDGMNIADLLAHYGQSLATLMRAQFPAQHDPTNPAHLLPLPPLARALYTAQAHVVQAALKLLGTGEAPLVLGEVGSGNAPPRMWRGRTFPGWRRRRCCRVGGRVYSGG